MKVLVIGLGSIGKKHVNALWNIDENFELYALRSSQRSLSLPKVSNVFSYADAKNINADFVIISNPTALHEVSIRKVLNWNTPLFIEKPVVHTLQPIADLVARVGAKGTLTYVGCNLRFLDCLLYIKSYLKENEGRLNEVNIYCGSYLPAWRPGREFRKTYSATTDLGGGVHLDLLHELDYAYWIYRKPKEVRKILRSKSTLGIDAVDYAHYNLIYDNYVLNITLNYFRSNDKRTMEILFENETIVVDLLLNKVVSNRNGVIFESDQRMPDTYLQQMKYFVELVKFDKNTSLNTLQENVEVLKICLSDDIGK